MRNENSALANVASDFGVVAPSARQSTAVVADAGSTAVATDAEEADRLTQFGDDVDSKIATDADEVAPTQALEVVTSESASQLRRLQVEGETNTRSSSEQPQRFRVLVRIATQAK